VVGIYLLKNALVHRWCSERSSHAIYTLNNTNTQTHTPLWKKCRKSSIGSRSDSAPRVCFCWFAFEPGVSSFGFLLRGSCSSERSRTRPTTSVHWYESRYKRVRCNFRKKRTPPPKAGHVLVVEQGQRFFSRTSAAIAKSMVPRCHLETLRYSLFYVPLRRQHRTVRLPRACGRLCGSAG